MKSSSKYSYYIEYKWRHWIFYPLLRFLLRNQKVDTSIDIRSIKKMLILRYDRICDMIVTTPILHFLKELNPSLFIGVFASISNEEIIRDNPYVNVIHILSSNWWQIFKQIRNARAQKYDLVLNLIFNRTTSGGILANLIAPRGIKIGQGADKYHFYFNRLLKLERDIYPMVDTIVNTVEQTFGVNIPKSKRVYEIHCNNDIKSKVQNYLDNHLLSSRHHHVVDYLPYLVLNLSTFDYLRRLTEYQASELILHLFEKDNIRTVVIVAPEDHKMKMLVQKSMEKNKCIIFPDTCIATLREITELISGACCVITPDTSIVHFASATKTPVLGFYSSAKQNIEWLPYQVHNSIIVSENNLPVSSIPVEILNKSIDDFFETL